VEIAVVTSEAELPQLLALMRAYCDFYKVSPTDASLLSMSRALITDPEREGVQFIATENGATAGFATLFWTWATSDAARIGVMNDLYVAEAFRRRGVGRELVNVCLQRCRERGARRLTWQTAPDNLQAQALYDGLGAVRETWVDYWIGVEGS
jgi:GNAT superfamily N-acetyltransferase